MKYAFAVIFALGAIFIQSQHVNAATTPDTCGELKAQFEEFQEPGLAEQFKKYCSETEVYKKLVNILYGLVGSFAVIMLMVGGIIYMTARGDAAQSKKGRDILIWTIAGLALVILAAAIVNIVARLLMDNSII